ncbi:MAG TPA: RNA polymerase sigma factor [Thermoanaerobaculia bacterium]|nr:RNA polymerase sigma factor [Thermoanaerobaculia bacterium]
MSPLPATVDLLPELGSAASEEELGELLAEGSREELLAALMRLYGPAIYRYCRQMVKDAELAEEAHQMTFVQAYESLSSFAGRSSLRSWLFSIARHRSLDAAKIARRRRRRFQLVAEPPEAPAPEPVAEERLARESLGRLVRQCLSELAPRTRSALLLRFQQELPYEEIGLLSGERAGTLRVRVTRALPLLRRCLERRGFRP